MAERATQLTGFFLYVNARKQKANNRSPFKIYYRLCEETFQDLCLEQQAAWNKRASDIQFSNEALFFHGVDLALKCSTDENISKSLLKLRNHACVVLYGMCNDLL